MSSWQHRLYAFLLRRALNPILNDESVAQLHHHLQEISIQDGTCTLTDLTFRTDFLNSYIGTKLPLLIRSARVHKLTIRCTIQETKSSCLESDDTFTTPTSYTSAGSLAWKAFQWSKMMGGDAIHYAHGSKISLFVQLLVDGLIIELEPYAPASSNTHQNSSNDSDGDSNVNKHASQHKIGSPADDNDDGDEGDDDHQNSSKGNSKQSFLSSYLDAALRSLELSVDLTNLNIKLWSSTDQLTLTDRWVQISLQSVTYNSVPPLTSLTISDTLPETRMASTSMKTIIADAGTYQTTLHKALTVAQVTVVVGATSTVSSLSSSPSVSTLLPNRPAIIARCEGSPSRVTLRIMEFRNKNDVDSTECDHGEPSHDQNVDMKTDVEVHVRQIVRVSLDVVTLSHLHAVLQSFYAPSQSSWVDQSAANPITVPGQLPKKNRFKGDINGNNDMDILTSIVRQYQQAREQVERNQLRGGILLPSADYTKEGDEMEFDAFFDANERSFYHYSTVLQQSILAPRSVVTKDYLQTQLRLHVQQASLKISFPAASVETHARPGVDEYILFTLYDLNVSSSLSAGQQDHTMSIDRFDAEDSLIVPIQDSRGQSRVEIASIARFAPLSPSTAAATTTTAAPPPNSTSDHELSDWLVQSSCLSVIVQTQNNATGESTVVVDVVLQPLEITCRASTMHHVIRFLDAYHDIIERTAEPASLSAVATSTVGKSLLRHEVSAVESNDTETSSQASIRMLLACPSATIHFPVPTEKESWSRLFYRCGYPCPMIQASRKTTLSITLEAIEIDCNQKGDLTGEDVSLSVAHILTYVTSVDKGNALPRHCQRLDVLALAGRSEVSPVIPISVKIWNKNQNRGSIGEVLFPRVPAISSFKARQEDEDEDTRVDRVLCSSLGDVDVSTRKQLRAADSQIEMIAKASSSDLVVAVNIPEIIIDVTTEEAILLHEIISAISSSQNFQPSSKTMATKSKEQTHAVSTTLSVAVACSDLTMCLHEPVVSDSEDNPRSFMVKIATFQVHVCVSGGRLHHTRMLCHDFHFCMIDRIAREMYSQGAIPSSSWSKISHFRNRTSASHESCTRPILHRSHLFEPISSANPSILIDCVFPSPSSLNQLGLSESNVFVTFYDVTFRFDYDIIFWIDKLKSLLTDITDGISCPRPPQLPANAISDPSSSLTRVFLSVADCNIDYNPPARFRTAARLILRLGDLRLSSNIVLPVTPTQAFSLSIGDVACYFCNERFPYNYENSCLIGASTLLRTHETSLHIFRSLQSRPSPEAVLRMMNYVTILRLDTLDAVLAISTPERATDPYLRASLTVGEISCFACKDSFSRFVNVIGEISAEATALDENQFSVLNSGPTISNPNELFDDSTNREPEDPPSLPLLQAVQRAEDSGIADFLLDGYDWTTIDFEGPGSVFCIPPGEEQVARWYTNDEESLANNIEAGAGVCLLAGLGESKVPLPQRPKAPHIITHHFQLVPVADPLDDGDMGAWKYSGSATPPQVRTRVLIHDLSLKLRFFDGFDWPELLSDDDRSRARTGPFIIDDGKSESSKQRDKDNTGQESKERSCADILEREHKAMLLGTLLDSPAEKECSAFSEVPLPEEKGLMLKEQFLLKKLTRRTGRYFHISASGVTLRLDSMESSVDHRLASCLNLKAQDFFLAETISSNRPIKMIGEWLNEKDHPRDSRVGLVALKMVTWHAAQRVTPDDQIANDETEFALKLLPLRCLLDQRAIRFARAFFHNNDGDTEPMMLPTGLHAIPPPLLRSFRVRPLKLKVDYKPEKIDAKALRDGAIVELINLSPLDGMVLTLQEVIIENEVGFGPVIGILVQRWIQDICATQLVKFVANARPLEPITNVGASAFDLVVLPWEAFQSGDSISRALRSGVSSLASAVVYETFHTASQMSEFVAQMVSRVTSTGSTESHPFQDQIHPLMLPSRPLRIPRTIGDASPHAWESICRGLRTAGYKIVVVPYREYHRSGASGAARCVLRGIPVAIAAPTSGVAEAVSFTLLGARNQLRPDIRKEEEASLRGLHLEG